MKAQSSRVTLQTLKDYFEGFAFSDQPLRLDSCTVINDQKKFFESHIAVLDANPGNATLLPFYDRLVKYYHLIKNQ